MVKNPVAKTQNTSVAQDAKLKNFSMVNNGAFVSNMLSKRAKTHHMSQKITEPKRTERVKVKVFRTSTTSPCFLAPTTTDSTAEISGKHPNTLFTSHNWGYRK